MRLGVPRVRGCLPPAMHPFVTGPSVLACAGMPTGPDSTSFSGHKPPRVCGDAMCQVFVVNRCRQASSRVRGNPISFPTWKAYRPSLLACAGKSKARPVVSFSQVKPPRVCGEIPKQNAIRRRVLQASSRVRGNLMPSVEPVVELPSLLACAGKSLRNASPESHIRRFRLQRPDLHPTNRSCRGRGLRLHRLFTAQRPSVRECFPLPLLGCKGSWRRFHPCRG